MFSEFELISRYFQPTRVSAYLGIGDDAALLSPEPGHCWAISMDMLVEGQHFFPGVPAYHLGHKTLAVNLSDLAAMGASPSWCLLAMALPRIDEAWISDFSRGFFALAQRYSVELVGGDLTRGPLTLCVQIAGSVPKGQALRRDGAVCGDEVWVCGYLGAAAAAVMERNKTLALSENAQAACLHCLELPEPRIALGKALRGIASAAIDISDGLVKDLERLCQKSSCRAVIEWEQVPVHPALSGIPPTLCQTLALSGGDDYELCFTVPPQHHDTILALEKALALPLRRLGFLHKGSGVTVLESGLPVILECTGFDHFA